MTDATVTLGLSAELVETDEAWPVSAERQAELMVTLDNVLVAVHTAAAERRLLPESADVTELSELARTWQPVTCRDGEVHDDDDLTTCCESAPSVVS